MLFLRRINSVYSMSLRNPFFFWILFSLLAYHCSNQRDITNIIFHKQRKVNNISGMDSFNAIKKSLIFISHQQRERPFQFGVRLLKVSFHHHITSHAAKYDRLFSITSSFRIQLIFFKINHSQKNGVFCQQGLSVIFKFLILVNDISLILWQQRIPPRCKTNEDIFFQGLTIRCLVFLNWFSLTS